MTNIRLANWKNASFWQHVMMMAKRKPSYLIFTTFVLFAAAPFCFWIFSPAIAQMISLAFMALAAVPLVALIKEYYRILHIFSVNDLSKKHYDVSNVVIDNELIIELDYQDHTPICKVHSTDPYKVGLGFAKLMPRQSLDILEGFYELLPTTLQLLYIPTQSRVANIHRFIEDCYQSLTPNFPPYYEAQIRGFLKGINEFIDQENQKWMIQKKHYTEADIKKLICLPDICAMLGCSAIIKRKATEQSIELLRTLDWPSLGKDSSTIVCLTRVANKHPDRPSATASLTLPPGIIGLSMANDKNLCLTINEAGNMKTVRREQNGIPEILFTRELARNCASIADVIAYLEQHQPLSSHNLTIIDGQGNGAVIQILPIGTKERYSVRPLTEDALVVTNHHEVAGEKVPFSESWPDSTHRYDALLDALEQGKKGWSLLGTVNERVTMHSLRFKLQGEHNTLLYRCNNAFSGHDAVHTHRVDLTQKFDELLGNRPNLKKS